MNRDVHQYNYQAHNKKLESIRSRGKMKTMSNKQIEDNRRKRLPIWSIVLIDMSATAAMLAVFMFFSLVFPRIQEQRAAEQIVPARIPVTETVPSLTAKTTAYERSKEYTPADNAPSLLPSEHESQPAPTTPLEPGPTPESMPDRLKKPEEQQGKQQEEQEEQEPVDDWKFGYLTTAEPILTETTYSSHDIYINITSYEAGQGAIESPYTVADIYVRDVRCLQSYFAGEKYIPTGHGEELLEMMQKSGAIVASNGDYYNLQYGSGVVRNGIVYRYPTAQFDVFVLYEDGSVQIYRSKTIHTKAEWEKVFENAWQAWSFGPSLLDHNGEPCTDLRERLFGFIVNRNPRTGIGYFEPGHYCLVVVDGRSNIAPGATIEEFASLFASLGCRQTYNLDGGASSIMGFAGEVITNQSRDRKLPDIILVAEYEDSFAKKEAQISE